MKPPGIIPNCRQNQLPVHAGQCCHRLVYGYDFGLIVSFASVGSEGIPEAEKTVTGCRYIRRHADYYLGIDRMVLTLIVYTYLVNQTTRIIDEMDEHLVKLINLITGNR
jgi:hypothetical protein